MRPVITELQRSNGHLPEVAAAELLGVSPSHFRSLFKKYLGQTFQAARLRIKLSYGATLLLAPQSLNISQIAAMLGYSERGKFDKAFKGVYGLTPAQYRKCKKK
jgi:AraC family transcriptional regulator